MVWAYIRALDALNGRLRRQEGQALVEYALILALVAVVAVGALTLLGTNISNMLSSIANSI